MVITIAVGMRNLINWMIIEIGSNLFVKLSPTKNKGAFLDTYFNEKLDLPSMNCNILGVATTTNSKGMFATKGLPNPYTFNSSFRCFALSLLFRIEHSNFKFEESIKQNLDFTF